MPLPTQLIQLIPPVLNSGYCWQDPQRYAIDIFSRASAIFRSDIGNSFFNYGHDVPSADNRQFPWMNTTNGRWYFWNGGIAKWTSPVPRPPNGEVIFWPRSEADLWFYDEGDGTDPSVNLPSAYTGAMWQRFTSMNGRMPIGAGAVPNDAPSNRTLSPGNTGGQGSHGLTIEEMPPHVHNFKVIAYNSSAGGHGALTGGDNNNANDGEFNGATDNAGGDTATPPVVVPHENLSPYFCGIWAVRTSRIWYTIPG